MPSFTTRANGMTKGRLSVSVKMFGRVRVHPRMVGVHSLDPTSLPAKFAKSGWPPSSLIVDTSTWVVEPETGVQTLKLFSLRSRASTPSQEPRLEATYRRVHVS